VDRGAGRIKQAMSVALILGGTCVVSAGAIFYFYGLHGTATLYPYKTQVDQDIAIWRTALIATIASSWAIWFGVKRNYSVGIVMLRAGLATLATLILYGIAGGEGLWLSWNISDWSGSNFIFPSTFFSEFNSLTFIFQVAPTVSVAEALLLGLCLKWVRLRQALPR